MFTRLKTYVKRNNEKLDNGQQPSIGYEFFDILANIVVEFLGFIIFCAIPVVLFVLLLVYGGILWAILLAVSILIAIISLILLAKTNSDKTM